MKRVLLIISICLMGVSSIFSQNVNISTAYDFPPQKEDSLLFGLRSIRGMYYQADPFGDGTSAILVSNYLKNGAVSLLVSAGNDALELVWTSPLIEENGESSTPRYPLIGDLDNDGVVEMIYQSNGNGIYIYEWDGVAGSYNFGDKPSQIIRSFADLFGNFEYAEIMDIDSDGSNELIVAYNAVDEAADGYYIISATGSWTTGSPGFSSFKTEFEALRNNYPNYELTGGSPYAMIAAQLDGTGNKEILIHNWNNKNITPMRVNGANSYQLADTVNGKQNIMLFDTDEVALFSGIAADIDGDGREEIYLPTYDTGDNRFSIIHMIHYEAGQTPNEIDLGNVLALDLNSGAVSDLLKGSTFGAGYGDIDNDGKKNIYISSAYGANVTTMEFMGGDKLDPNNWEMGLIYAGEPDIYTKITITDSAGVIDTAYSIDASFASKIWGRETDFDNDGFEDIILPYQALSDSIMNISLVWNGSGYDADTVQTVNPKRWSLRILESTGTTGVEAKELSLITPNDYKLEQNYPNPFNPSTTIRFSIPLDKKISLTIYDILGNEINTLLDSEEFKKGTYEVTWDGKDNFNQKVASGTYIYTLKYGNFSSSMKMLLIK